MRLIERESKGILKPGQDLVMAGYAGREGSRRIAIAREEELNSWFSRDYIEQMKQNDNFEIDDTVIPWQDYGASEWETVGEGGIFTALWNLSGAYQTGFEVDLYQIPVRQETIELCERYDLNPYRLLSSNCVLAAADHGGHLIEALSKKGIPAFVIGRVKQGIKREIYYGQVRGFLERPREDQIYRILPNAPTDFVQTVQHEKLHESLVRGDLL